MKILNSLVLSFAMFSKIPMPHTDWSKENMRYIMAFFPVIGVVVGLFAMAFGTAANVFSFSPLLRGAGFFCIPILLTGGIHLDGFCDTVDALSSHAPAEKKQEILKDPRLGAFAAIYLAVYAVAYTGFAAEAACTQRFLIAYLLLHVLTRSLSGLAIVFFPCARDSGLAHSFSDSAARKSNGIVLGCFTALSAAALVFSGGLAGITAVLLTLVILWCYHRVAMQEFQGISGDLAGWFLQLAELAGLAALALLPR